MRFLLPILLVCSLGTPAWARPIDSLDPFAAGLGFEPQQPRAVGVDHPLFGRILVEEVRGMPGRIGGALMPVTNPREFNAALRSALAASNMLAGSPQAAKARLRVTWRRFELPFRIGLSSRAAVAVHYELSRIDNGEVIFSREIVTEARARGGNAATRAQGTGRAAVATNIASAAFCLDRAAIAPAPADCALTPTGRFSAPIVVPALHRRYR